MSIDILIEVFKNGNEYKYEICGKVFDIVITPIFDLRPNGRLNVELFANDNTSIKVINLPKYNVNMCYYLFQIEKFFEFQDHLNVCVYIENGQDKNKAMEIIESKF